MALFLCLKSGDGLKYQRRKTGMSDDNDNDREGIIEAFITNLGKYNEGTLTGEWVSFPATLEDIQKVFERIGIGTKNKDGSIYEEWFITDYNCNVDGLAKNIDFGEYESLDELNYLASKISELNSYGLEKFQGALEAGDYTGSIKDVINLTDNLDKYEVYPDVKNCEDLGIYYLDEIGTVKVPDELRYYIDYESYGRDIALEENGQFIEYGYVRDNGDSFEEYYDGTIESIPEEYRVMGFMEAPEKGMENMDYESFKKEFTDDIKEKLDELGYGDVKVIINNMKKVNKDYEAMDVVPEGSIVGVSFSLEDTFARYEQSGDYDSVLKGTASFIADGLEITPKPDINTLMNYDEMKGRLSIEVISAEANKELLTGIPHDRIEDLAAVYRFALNSGEMGKGMAASILITNKMIEMMGVTHEQLKNDALRNAPKIRPAVITGMSELMKDMMGKEAYELAYGTDDADEMMFVATVPGKDSGAGILVYQDFMDKAAERVGGDFFILPSSIHEVLLVIDTGDMKADALRDMVKHINKAELKPEDILSDNVYHYDSKEHIFELAEKFEARQKERTAGIEMKAHGRDSVIKDMKSKQKEVSQMPIKNVPEKTVKSKGGETL